MAKNTVLWVLVVIIGLAVLATLAIVAVNMTGGLHLQNIAGDSNGGSGDGNTNVAVYGGCAIPPSIGSVFTDFYQPGTSVSPTNYYVDNGIYTGTTTSSFSKGDKVQVLATNTSYISEWMPNTLTLDCGVNPVSGKLKAYANATVTVYSNAGTAVLTNSATGGAQKETTMSTAKVWKVHMVGTSLKSTSKILLIHEFSIPANISSDVLSGPNGVVTPVTVPTGYTRQLTNGYVQAWEIPALENGAIADYYINAQPTSSTTSSGAVYLTFIGEQGFFDAYNTNPAVSNIVQYGAYDSLNTARYVTGGKYTYNFLMV